MQFPQFSNLPFEIRLMIWRSIPRGPKVFVADAVGPDSPLRLSVNLGSISRVCRESRDAVLHVNEQVIKIRKQRFGVRTDGWGAPYESRLFSKPGEDVWVSRPWLYFEPLHDSIYLNTNVFVGLSEGSLETLQTLVGMIRRIIMPHPHGRNIDHLSFRVRDKLRLDSVSLVSTTMALGEPLSSLLSDRLGATMPLVVNVEDVRAVKIVEDVLIRETEALELWKSALKLHDGPDTYVYAGFPCSWPEFRQRTQSDWLQRIRKGHPLGLEDEVNPPIDQDGLILNYNHPWVKQWAPHVPQLKGVVMFIHSNRKLVQHWTS